MKALSLMSALIAFGGKLRLPITASIGFAACLAIRADEPMTLGPSLAGHWKGTAIFVNEGLGLFQKHFPVDLLFHRNGTVTGTVGAAKLIEGRIERHRPRNLSEKESSLMDYMIKGRPDGIVCEDVTALNVFIPLDDSGRTLIGAVHFHDSSVGHQEVDILSAELVLKKAQ